MQKQKGFDNQVTTRELEIFAKLGADNLNKRQVSQECLEVIFSYLGR